MVVAILTALALIAVPTYSDIKTRTRIVRCTSEIRDIEKLIVGYSIDHGGQFPATLADVGDAGAVDPWGNPYTYTNLALNPSAARLDPIGNPINTFFDLYSNGEDGKPDTSDDIIYSGDGGYVGIASPTNF